MPLRVSAYAITAAMLTAGPALAAHHHQGNTRAAHAAHHANHGTHRTETPRQPSTPSGATAIPAGGIKLFCGPHRAPLMVRKMTQGQGTTVTVICR